jgi:hypothetical protein
MLPRVLRQRAREGAPPLPPIPPATASHRLANPTLVLCMHALRHWYLMAQPLVTRALFAPATPLPAPRESWHNPTLFAHMPSPCSRHAHCVYRLLCLLVGSMIKLSPSSTSPLWCACPELHTCSPPRLLPTTLAHAHCVTRED